MCVICWQLKGKLKLKSHEKPLKGCDRLSNARGRGLSPYRYGESFATLIGTHTHREGRRWSEVCHIEVDKVGVEEEEEDEGVVEEEE